MEKLEQSFKNYIAMTSGMTIAMIILGLVFIFMPGTSLDIIRWIVVSCLVAAGLYSLMAFASLSGIIILIIGLVVALNPSIINIIPILLGSYIILSSSLKLFSLSSLRATSRPSFTFAATLSVIGIICGVVMIAHPDATNNFAMRLVGIMMLVYGVADFIELMIMRHNVNSFTKNIRAGNSKNSKNKGTPLSSIQEGKVVKKK